MAELKDPKDFPKALATLQIIDISLYVIAATVIYRYAGADVTSPALGSAGPLISRIAYGIALPTVSPRLNPTHSFPSSLFPSSLFPSTFFSFLFQEGN